MPNGKKGKNGKVRKGKALQLNYGPSQFAQQRAIRVTLPWTATVTLTEAAAGAGISYSFVINSAFDPNFTGIGSQPLGFDQYAALYSRYRVISARYKLVCATRAASAACRWGVFPSPQSTLTADVNAWPVQNRWAKFGVVNQMDSGPSVITFTGKLDIAAIAGVTNAEFLTEHDFAAGTGGSPSRAAYLHVWTASSSANVSTGSFTLLLYQDVEFMAPVALGLS
jgi:hypothetical protein